MIARDRDTDNNGSLDQRVYVIQDANWNITAIANSTGAVVERFQYDAYGKRTVLSPTFVAASDTFVFNHGFAGGKTDTVTGRVNFRNREYDVDLMRWTTMDPIGFAAGDMNWYQYVGAGPTGAVDPSGEFAQILGGALIGAAFGAGFAYFSGGNVWAGAISGGVGGAVFGATFNPLLARASALGVGAVSANTLANLGAGAAGGFAGGLTSEGFSVANGNDFSGSNVAESTAAGAFLAHMGGRVASGAGSQAARALRKNPNGKPPCESLDNAGAPPSTVGNTSNGPKGPISPKTGAPIPTPSNSQVPSTVINDAQTAISHISEGTNPGWGGKWGVPHKNLEGNLPKLDAAGNPIAYSEYYLPKSRGDTTKWGANRLVVGSDGNSYSTTTHYGQSGNPPFVHVGPTQ